MRKRSLLLRAADRDAILRAALSGAPREVCGLLLGRWGEREVRVAALHPARNLLERPGTFEVDPGDVVAAEDGARSAGLELVGVWHSHVGAPAEPSEADRRAAFPGWIQLVASLGAPGRQWGELRAWRLGRGREDEELDLRVVASGAERR